MGSEARVYVFDYRRYRDHVVPAVKVWLLEFRLPSEAWKLIAGRQLPFPGANLSRDCTTLGDDLRFLGAAEPVDDAWWDDWDERRCRASRCPSTRVCPWYLPDAIGGAETANVLLDRLVARAECLHESVFVGRSFNTGKYHGFLDELGVGAGDRLPQLLAALGTRGRLVGYQFADSDGIHGWLDEEETRELLNELAAPRLPMAEPVPWRPPVQPWPLNDHAPLEGVSWEVESLLRVRAIAERAQREDRGILWGNDMMFGR